MFFSLGMAIFKILPLFTNRPGQAFSKKKILDEAIQDSKIFRLNFTKFKIIPNNNIQEVFEMLFSGPGRVFETDTRVGGLYFEACAELKNLHEHL